MLLADPPRRDDAAGGRRDGRAEYPLQHENPFRVVSQSAVTVVGDDLLGLVKLSMQGQVLLRDAAPFSDRGESVVIGVRHVSTSLRWC